MIAMAIACEPDILIADEPTTALDVTIQAQILDLLKELQRKNGMAIVLITHDLGVVARMADDVAVMYAGEIVEKGSVDDVFYRVRASLHAGAARCDAEQRDVENAKGCGRSKARRRISSIRRPAAPISRAARTRCGSASATIRRASTSAPGTIRVAGCTTTRRPRSRRSCIAVSLRERARRSEERHEALQGRARPDRARRRRRVALDRGARDRRPRRGERLRQVDFRQDAGRPAREDGGRSVFWRRERCRSATNPPTSSATRAACR